VSLSRSEKYSYDFGFGLSASLFESQEIYVGDEKGAPIYKEINSPDLLRNEADIINDLFSIDWSFTKDKTGFLTHDLHPYPAKFIPQIPGHLISRLSLRGELIFDPFGGSGTTALEAVRLGRRAFSIDANAIGTLIGKVKTGNLDQVTATDIHAIQCSLASRLTDIQKEPSILCEEYARFIPEIANIDKWFPLTSRGELAFIKSKIAEMESEKAKNISQLALSRIILPVSFQDSETRYSSKPRVIPPGETIKRFIKALDEITQSIIRTQAVIRYGVCDFLTADARELKEEQCNSESIDLIVTSPPYANVTDYHLYHRFRLLWLGHDPRLLAKIEIGSHLRHQKEATGFENYLSEMKACMATMHRVLKSGRYAAMIIGDAIYDKVLYQGAESLRNIADGLGFETLCIIERPLHANKRAFISAARRATNEKILILRKPVKKLKIWFQAPPYKLWPYEEILRQRELEVILGSDSWGDKEPKQSSGIDPYNATNARKLVFTHKYGRNLGLPTWQSILENGFALQPATRKDPKYVTHGIHSYKGKFYPQLAKGLINLSGLKPGSNILDPFCGSGTTLLEGYLNGYNVCGCDMHPLAAKIARTKIGILEVSPDIIRETLGIVINRIERAPSVFGNERDQFSKECIDEIERWFSHNIINKLNWILRLIRGTSDGIIREFLEILLSSIIRDISHQDPNDLRIRKRKIQNDDADVLSMYMDVLDTQYDRIERFWSVRGYAPNRFLRFNVSAGDSREWQVFKSIGADESTTDLILTSPPYATALPYIDTDRLSLLVLFGMDSSSRRPLEQKLVGSREITTGEKKHLEKFIEKDELNLPQSLRTFLSDLNLKVNKADVGFRRRNMPALLMRFFSDMKAIMENCYRALRPRGQAMIVIGDNRMKLNGDDERIATTDFIQDIASECGLNLLERIDVSVTTENLVHIKNAIKQNVVLRMQKPI